MHPKYLGPLRGPTAHSPPPDSSRLANCWLTRSQSRDPKASAPSNALRSCSWRRGWWGSGCGKLKRDQGKHRKNQLPIGGACVLNKKQLANASYLGKNMFEESTMEKKKLPPRTKTQFARNQLNAFIWGSHKTSIYTNTSIFIQYLSLQRGHMSLQWYQTSLREYIYIYLTIY